MLLLLLKFLPAVVANPTSLFVADAYVAKIGVVGNNINTYEGANVISIVISPYNDVSIIDVDTLPPKIPKH